MSVTLPLRRSLVAIFLLVLATGYLLVHPARAQSSGQTEGPYSRARVWLGAQGLSQLQQMGVAVDHGEGKVGLWFESDFSAAELTSIRHAGLRYDVKIADVGRWYAEQNQQPAPVSRVQSGLTCDPVTRYNRPQSFRLGSMGGFCTYQEIMNKLDSMAQRWPNLITIKQPLGAGRTIENRPVYWVKISDNPNTNEPEPEMLYTGVHHAREPMSVSHLLYYMYYLLENYATNAEIRALVNNTELYFVPCLNPDGYIFNETTAPQGGGMWRKNRRDNQDGSFGIDLNRNYGEHWGHDDLGSSPDGFMDTYRGTAAFSESETQLLRDFALQHQFRLALNYHAFSNVLIYPYGYAANTYTPDSALFVDYGQWLTRDDRYTTGTCNQVLGYVSNGDANDWQYNTVVAGGKPKTFSFTPEIGSASVGFWPPASQIEELCYQNLTRDLDATRLLLSDAILADRSPRFFRQRTAFVRYSIKQLGLKTPGTYTVAVTPLAGAGTAGPTKTYTLNTLRQERLDSIRLTLPTTLGQGQTFRYVLSVNNGLYTRRDTLTKVFGIPTVAFSSDGSSLTGWDPNTFWDLDTQLFHSPPAALGDSPGTDYSDGFENAITTQTIDLRQSVHAQLSFWARWAIETRFDYAQVQVSTDNGVSWQALCGRNMRPGNGFQRLDEPIMDGFNFTWVQEQISLDDFVGRRILLRFTMNSDQATAYDGLTIDDIRIEKIGTVTGLAADQAPLTMRAWPNPATATLRLSHEALPRGGTLVVTDALGREVSRQPTAGATETTLDVRAWVPGLYVARLLVPDRAATPVRFVVER